MNYGVNFSKCIQEIHNIGSTTFTNICDGSTHVVNWGVADWIGYGALGALVAGISIFFLGLFTLLIREVYFDNF